MILARFVDKVPDLKLTHAYRLVALMLPAVHERLHAEGAGWFGGRGDERLDVPEGIGDLGS